MGRGLWVTKSGATQGSLPCPHATSPHLPEDTGPVTPAPSSLPAQELMRAPDLCPGHSLEAPGGEEEQLSGQRPHGAQPGGGQRLLGAILGCLQLRDPVGEPPVGCVPGGWGMGSTSVFLLPLWCFFFYSTSRYGSAPGIHHQPSSLFSSQKQLIQGIPLNTACKKGLSDLSLLPESELCTPNIPTSNCFLDPSCHLTLGVAKAELLFPVLTASRMIHTLKGDSSPDFIL